VRALTPLRKAVSLGAPLFGWYETAARFAWLALLVAVAGHLVAACGGKDAGLGAANAADSSTNVQTGATDASGDSSLTGIADGAGDPGTMRERDDTLAFDASTNAHDTSLAMQETGVLEAAPIGCTPGLPCVNPANGSQGVCPRAGGTCGACENSPTGDKACLAAYGRDHIYACTNGACMQGTCRSAEDCDAFDATRGQLCASGVCVACGADDQCSADAYYAAKYFSASVGPGTMCNTSTGRCVSAACNRNGVSCGAAPNTNGNPSELCCFSRCVAGALCCQDSDCAPRQVCDHSMCVGACGPQFASRNSLVVDPVAGVDDAQTSGSSGCPFRSITHALAAMVKTGVDHSTIYIVNDKAAPTLGVSTGEVFPIVVTPTNVAIQPTIFGANTPTLVVPAGQTGIATSDSGLQIFSLIIDGQNHQASVGIAIYGSTAPVDGGLGGIESILQNVTVQGMAVAGLVIGPAPGQTVSPRTLSLGPGVVVRNNGTVAAPAPGLHLYGEANVSISGGAGADHSSFSGNSQYGILVSDRAYFATLSTSPIDSQNPDAADVDADNNGLAGVWIAQGAGTVPSGGLNDITGLRASGNPIGLRVGAGSYLRLRYSYLGNDTQAGLVIASSGGAVDDLGTIDLGTRFNGDYGFNVFAAPASTATGICFQLGAGVHTIAAAGNIFGNTDCSKTNATLRRSLPCGNTDIGGLSPTDMTSIDVSLCK